MTQLFYRLASEVAYKRRVSGRRIREGKLKKTIILLLK